VLLDAQAPESPINRRISIVVMNKRTEDAIAHENGTLLSVQDSQPGQPAGEPVAAAAQETGGAG
jgi:chemotaxis protein MotB